MALDSYAVGLIMVLGTTLLSIGGLLLVRKKVSPESLHGSHEVAGYLLSIVGTMYAVLLGLVVVDALSKFEDARNNTQAEANSLADVFLLSEKFPSDKQKAIKALCLRYAELVINEEWKQLDDEKYCVDARKVAINLMRTVTDFEPRSQAEQQIYPLAVQQVCQLWDCRRTRINQAMHGVPKEEWAVLIVGGIVTIIFTYFFGVENCAIQITMTGMVSVVIGLNLLLVLWFGYPFSGDKIVRPDAFADDIRIFHNELGVHGSDAHLKIGSIHTVGDKSPRSVVSN